LHQQAQVALAEVNAQLKAANDSKDRFFTILAHDLRNPISSLVMLSEALHTRFDSFDKSSLREFVYRMYVSAGDFHSLLENLLTWSRLQIGAMPFQPRWISIEDQVLLLGRVVESSCAEKQLHLTITVPPQTHTWADPDMLQSVLLNLLTNAVKFTEPGGSVSLEVNPDDERLVFVVRDSGIGMTLAQQKSLFRQDESMSTPGTADE
jgi:signal transduction histidine kinase